VSAKGRGSKKRTAERTAVQGEAHKGAGAGASTAELNMKVLPKINLQATAVNKRLVPSVSHVVGDAPFGLLTLEAGRQAYVAGGLGDVPGVDPGLYGERASVPDRNNTSSTEMCR